MGDHWAAFGTLVLSAFGQQAGTTWGGYNWDRFGFQMLTTISFVLVGLAFFGLAFVVLGKVIKVPLRKEIEEDQNTALGLVIGSIILGISLIIAAAIHGGGP